MCFKYVIIERSLNGKPIKKNGVDMSYILKLMHLSTFILLDHFVHQNWIIVNVVSINCLYQGYKNLGGVFSGGEDDIWIIL